MEGADCLCSGFSSRLVGYYGWIGLRLYFSYAGFVRKLEMIPDQNLYKRSKFVTVSIIIVYVLIHFLQDMSDMSNIQNQYVFLNSGSEFLWVGVSVCQWKKSKL